MIFIIPWVSISLTERNNCSFPARLNEFFLNSGSKGLNITIRFAVPNNIIILQASFCTITVATENIICIHLYTVGFKKPGIK